MTEVSEILGWDLDDDGNWNAEWDGETVRTLVRLVHGLLDVVGAARAFMTDDYSWDREAKGDPGPALVAALKRLDVPESGIPEEKVK